MLVEALLLGGFFLLAIPFGYLSRTLKRRLKGWVKWPAYLGAVHAPVLPLIIFVKLTAPLIEFEAALVAFVLLGHLTGVLAHRHRSAAAARAPTPAADK